MDTVLLAGRLTVIGREYSNYELANESIDEGPRDRNVQILNETFAMPS